MWTCTERVDVGKKCNDVISKGKSLISYTVNSVFISPQQRTQITICNSWSFNKNHDKAHNIMLSNIYNLNLPTFIQLEQDAVTLIGVWALTSRGFPGLVGMKVAFTSDLIGF